MLKLTMVKYLLNYSVGRATYLRW